jgi:Cu(I)/Ag(I) efflux system membrane fusion protein
MSAAKQLAKTLFVRLRFILVFAAIGVVVGNWSLIMNLVDRWTRGTGADQVTGDHEWFCPMHPTVVRANDREKCPICGMPLSRRKKGETVALPPGVLSRLQLSPQKIRMGGIGVEEIGFRSLLREIRTVGSLEWDERKIAHPSARIAGRVDELYVNFTGQKIKAGDPLYKLYSPDLVTTQEEYLLSLRTLDELKAGSKEGDPAVERAKRLADAGRERMRLWGITDAQLAELEKTRKAQTHLVIASPVGGTVIKKDVDIGHYVEVGADAWTVADDSAFWMQAQVFERDLGLVKVGQSVELFAEAYPGRSFSGKVAFIAPEVMPDTRTAKVRVEVPNPDAALKAGMTMTAFLRIPLGRSGEVFYGC